MCSGHISAKEDSLRSYCIWRRRLRNDRSCGSPSTQCCSPPVCSQILRNSHRPSRFSPTLVQSGRCQKPVPFCQWTKVKLYTAFQGSFLPPHSSLNNAVQNLGQKKKWAFWRKTGYVPEKRKRWLKRREEEHDTYTGEYPSCRQTTSASTTWNSSSHTVPHSLSWNTSTRPSFELEPPASRIAVCKKKLSQEHEQQKLRMLWSLRHNCEYLWRDSFDSGNVRDCKGGCGQSSQDPTCCSLWSKNERSVFFRESHQTPNNQSLPPSVPAPAGPPGSVVSATKTQVSYPWPEWLFTIQWDRKSLSAQKCVFGLRICWIEWKQMRKTNWSSLKSLGWQVWWPRKQWTETVFTCHVSRFARSKVNALWSCWKLLLSLLVDKIGLGHSSLSLAPTLTARPPISKNTVWIYTMEKDPNQWEKDATHAKYRSREPTNFMRLVGHAKNFSHSLKTKRNIVSESTEKTTTNGCSGKQNSSTEHFDAEHNSTGGQNTNDHLLDHHTPQDGKHNKIQ